MVRGQPCSSASLARDSVPKGNDEQTITTINPMELHMVNVEQVLNPQAKKQEPGIIVMDNGNRFHLWVIGISPSSQEHLANVGTGLVQ